MPDISSDLEQAAAYAEPAHGACDVILLADQEPDRPRVPCEAPAVARILWPILAFPKMVPLRLCSTHASQLYPAAYHRLCDAMSRD